MDPRRPPSRPAFVRSACPRCGRTSASPFDAAGVCLRCAGVRVLDPAADFRVPSFELETYDGLPDRIGDCEIIEELGHGGMGRVFAARQIGLGRIVALKAIAVGTASADLELRFLREAQTIARLRHPLIVAIHDSGRANGFVYFTMDYLEGGDLARRLRTAPFGSREAAELVRKVAVALAYTHGQGVLHRDLKPSNILLDGDEPRVADFGLAAQLEAGGDLTAITGVLGTPHYLAPEALRHGSAALSVASDLYALGVILFEMLTGRTPFAGASPAELPTLIEQHEALSPRLIVPTLGRDLETICLKCLEHEPARRYASAVALAEDLQRFLAGEPILARPPGRIERWVKYARRHRAGFTASACVAVVLVAATGVSAALAVRATRAERFATTEAQSTRELADFLENDLLAQAAPGETPNRDVKLRAVLDRAARTLEERFADRPLVQVEICETLSRGYARIGDYAAGQRVLDHAIIISREELGADDPMTLRLLSELAEAHYNLADYGPARVLALHALERQLRVLSREHPDVLSSQNILGSIFAALGQAARAETLLVKTLRAQQRVLGHTDSATLETMGNLSSTYLDEGKFTEAEALLRPMLDLCQRTRGDENPYTLLAINNLAGALWCQGKFAEAGDLHRRNYEVVKRVLSPEHPDTLRSLTNVARCADAQGRYAEAATLHRQILEVRRRVLAADNHETLRSMGYLAACELALGNLAEAESLCRDAFTIGARVLGAAHPDTLHFSDGLAAILLAGNRPAEAEAILRASLEVRTVAAIADWQAIAARSTLGLALARQQCFAEAEPLLLESYADLSHAASRIPASERKILTDAGARIVQLYTDWNQPAKAAEWSARLAGAVTDSTPPK